MAGFGAVARSVGGAGARRRVLVVGFLLAAATGCGSDGAASSTESFAPPLTDLTPQATTTTATTTTTIPPVDDLGELENALVDQLLGSGQGSSTVPITEEQARCAANGVIDQVGADALRAAGAPEDFRPDQLAPDDQAAVVDALLNCVDIAGLFVEQLTGGAGLSDESAECLASRLEQSGVIRDVALAAIAAGDDAEIDIGEDVTAEVIAALSACVTPEELQRILAALAVTGGSA